MKHLLLFFTLLFNSSYSQSLNAAQIYQISNYRFDDLDYLMVTQHKFRRLRDIEDEKQKVYTNDSDKHDQLVVVTVIKDIKGCANILSIVNSSEADVNKLKKDLSLEGFKYQGKKNMSEEIIVSQFIKEKVAVSITDTRTSTGAFQVLLMCRY